MKSSPAATLNVFSAIPASPVLADNSSEERVAVLILNAGGTVREPQPMETLSTEESQ